MDSAGTGGDGANTINITTAASLVAAAGGVRMVKHGNRSVSSKSGSADVLEALNIPLDLDVDRSSLRPTTPRWLTCNRCARRSGYPPFSIP